MRSNPAGSTLFLHPFNGSCELFQKHQVQVYNKGPRSGLGSLSSSRSLLSSDASYTLASLSTSRISPCCSSYVGSSFYATLTHCENHAFCEAASSCLHSSQHVWPAWQKQIFLYPRGHYFTELWGPTSALTLRKKTA